MMLRLIVVLIALVLMSGCAAFDNSAGEPFEGFSADEAPVKSVAGGPYSGYFSGDMKLGRSECRVLGEEAAQSTPLGIEIVHNGNQIGVMFDSGQKKVVGLSADKATVMTEVDGVNYVYYLNFNKEKPEIIEGTCEMIEPDDVGQLGDACGSYTFTLNKGEKPEVTAEK